MKVGVLAFPGSNCDQDALHVAGRLSGAESILLWHKERDLKNADAIIVPGGFSYGDYLRCGAIARFSPVMEEVTRFAEKGGPVLGICNGFQILTEAGLLPGALLQNASRHFVCKTVTLTVENNTSMFTRRYAHGQRMRMPVAHGEGNYFVDAEGLRQLEGEGRIAFRYAPGENPNGSLADIAGVLNARGNVLGMMPHPERAAEKLLGSEDGRGIFEALVGRA
ncbi:MAG: phosphoribosylformylglycinamidine synthase subunit PurQ [Myxococcaceae bacterium]